MGMSASVRLVVGVPYRVAIRTETIKREETRYDEKTGKPYQKEISESRLMLGNREMDPKRDWDYDVLEKEFGMGLFDPDYDVGNRNHAIIGVVVCETEDICNDAKEVKIDSSKIEKCRLKALRAFAALDIDEGQMGLFMVPSVG